MKLVICICTYNRNSSLLRCLKSINNLHIVSNIKIEVVIVDNSIKYASFKLVKKLKKSFKYKIIQLNEKREGIVYARNKCLYKLKKINPKFMCFFDDDCIVDRFWLKNVIKTVKFTNAEVITGPMLPLIKKSLRKKNLINYPKFFERTYKEKLRKVNWAATNNVFLQYSIIKKHKLIFDKNLNKIGFGEDQLFFLKLNKCGHKIYWSKIIKVFENVDLNKSNLNWLIRRSFKVGIVGYYIDIIMYGRFKGFIINYLKCIYYFSKTFGSFFLFFNNKFRVQIFNYFSRFSGRLIGPLVLKK